MAYILASAVSGGGIHCIHEDLTGLAASMLGREEISLHRWTKAAPQNPTLIFRIVYAFHHTNHRYVWTEQSQLVILCTTAECCWSCTLQPCQLHHYQHPSDSLPTAAW